MGIESNVKFAGQKNLKKITKKSKQNTEKEKKNLDKIIKITLGNFIKITKNATSVAPITIKEQNQGSVFMIGKSRVYM